MGGIISGFIGGGAAATSEVGKMLFVDKLQQERDEANFLRDRELKKEDRQFTTSERMATQDFTSTENQRDRDANKEVAQTKANAAGNKPTTNMQDAASLRAAGYPAEVADAVAHGALKQIKDEETGDMVLVNALNNQPVGRLTSSEGDFGKKEWVPHSNMPKVDVKPTTADIEAASKEYDEKASMWKSDSSQFGMSEKAWKEKRAEELAMARAKPGAGIINSAKGGAEDAPAAPAENKPASKGKAAPQKKVTAEQYRTAMKARYKDISDEKLNELLEKAREQGRIK